MAATFYEVLAKVHWPPRERAIRSLLARYFLPDGTRPEEGIRLLDVGCGPGWLAATADAIGANYLGVDPSPPRREPRCREGTAREVEHLVAGSDVVVVNGTAHHLDDDEFRGLMASARRGRGAILCDHARDEHTGWRSRTLQALDRGRHVRPLAAFAQLEGWRRLETIRFPIRLLGVEAWDYFAAAYRPEASS